MFEDDHKDNMDLMFRSILENGQEEVPAHVWDGVASGLDKIARRRKAIVIFRRVAAASAAAAVLATGVFLAYRHGSDGLPAPQQEDGMIALIPQQSSADEGIGTILIADAVEAGKAVAVVKGLPPMNAEAAKAMEEVRLEENNESEVRETEPAEVTVAETAAQADGSPQINSGGEDMFNDEWEDKDTRSRHRIRTSLELSGLAGTNNSQNKLGSNIMKRPSISYSQEKTGIKENSTNSTFGIPLSFGAGVRFDFTSRWSLSAGLRYTLLTRKFYGTYTSVSEDGTIDWTETSDIRNSQHYVGIPVNAFFNIINRDFLRFYTYAGGSVEKCVADRYYVLSSSLVHTEKVKGVQFSVNAGIGVEFELGKHLGLYIDPSIRYYFNNGQPTSIRTVRPLMLGFEAGLRVRL